jgi:hypothetical protein
LKTQTKNAHFSGVFGFFQTTKNLWARKKERKRGKSIISRKELSNKSPLHLDISIRIDTRSRLSQRHYEILPRTPGISFGKSFVHIEGIFSKISFGKFFVHIEDIFCGFRWVVMDFFEATHSKPSPSFLSAILKSSLLLKIKSPNPPTSASSSPPIQL